MRNLEKLFVSLSTRNIAQNLQRNVILTTIDREAIYGWMRTSCISLQPRYVYRSYNSRCNGSSQDRVSNSVFASKNHVDVTSARMTIDKTRNLYKINIEVIFITESFKQYSFLDDILTRENR